MNEVKTTSERACGTCQFFFQHYILREESVGVQGATYQYVNCGHCTHPLFKKRVRDQRCERWSPREKQE